MNFQSPVSEQLMRELIQGGVGVMALFALICLVVVLGFGVWLFNRQLNNQARSIAVQEKNAETNRVQADNNKRAVTTLEELTDQMRSSNTAIALATKGIGDLGTAQIGTNQLITDKSVQVVREIVTEIEGVEQLLVQLFNDATKPEGVFIQAFKSVMQPEFDILKARVSELKVLIPTMPTPTPPPTTQPPPPVVTPPTLPPPPVLPPPTQPPAPGTDVLPRMPPRTDATLVYEDFSTAKLYPENSNDPGRRWVLGDSDGGLSEIIPHAGRKALQMRLNGLYKLKSAARAFYTNGGRWITLDGLDTLYVRYTAQLPETVNIDEGDGTEGLYATLGFQLKDGGATVNALVQINARTFNGSTSAYLALADGNVIQSDAFAYSIGKWTIVDLVIPLRKDRSAKIWTLFNGVLKQSGVARTLDVEDKGTGWGLTFQSNALRGPARVLFGWLVASSEPFTTPAGEMIEAAESIV